MPGWLDGVLTRLCSVRARLIITYVLVTVLSFGLLLFLLMGPIEDFLLQREEDQLIAVATTLGSTIRSPIERSNAEFQDDLKWTQRRCRLYLNNKLPNTRIRVLDTQGRTMADSFFTYTWNAWQLQRKITPPLTEAPEVRLAMDNHYGADTRFTGKETHRLESYRMYIALPIQRQNQLAFIMYLDRPLDSVMVNLRHIRHLIRYEMFASLLMTILVSILLSSHLSSGLHSAMQVARAFAAGNMTQRMREKGRDEVGQLGAAFNQMADAIQRQEMLRRNLLADVSHELRTPLTAISGCADTLAEGTLRDDPETAERFLGIIQRESQRLQRLVSDILELSKLQAGAIAIPLQPVALCPIITDAVEIADLHANQEGITIVFQPPADCAELYVQGNEDRLAQALRNLLDNARHHTPRGHKITVSMDVSTEAVTVHVRDEGEGIPKDDLPWVFDRFYRAGKGEKKPGGTGLGLAIVREIMLAHGGSIAVDSTVGAGTTFSLHLRRVQAEARDTLTACGDTNEQSGV